MAKAKKRRGPSLEHKYLGPEPNYHGYSFKNREEMQSEYHRASNWYNYYNNAKSNAPIVLLVKSYSGFLETSLFIKSIPLPNSPPEDFQ